MEKETQLEKLFRDKVKDTEYQILVAQWEYDKDLVPKALKNVGNIFPHYSLHDESHSNSILNNITNTLGEKAIKELSATDLWLLLEAAYCHDLGMVVTADKIEEALKDTKFSLLDFHSTIIADEANPLYDYANSFEQKDGQLLYKDNKFNVDSYNAVKYLLSGYFRKYHAKNVKAVIANPMKELSMASPRIGIPQRLFTVLGDICAAHGDDFDTVMKLNRVENGLGTDMAHPRFIACMLRIGDLLDIDDNRFSEMALRTLHKTKMPKDSILHYNKHHSIRHIRIDNRHIEATAVCPDPQVAKVTKEWFDWIADEFNHQTSHWNDIKPHNQDCYLPTVGDLNVDIEGYYNFDSKQMPQFTINTGKALELLQGNNLYNNIWDSIRELLQNAVDSTLIHYFLDKEYECKEQGEELTLDFYEALKALKDYPIEVNLDKGKKDEFFTLTIKDRGLGLKRDHLKFLSNTGNSSNNLEKKKIVERMPEWLKPSGTFGIGFQSVYLLTDKVDIVTKDYFTDECYELEMHKPSSGMRGDIYVKKHEERIHNSGLELKLKLNSPKVNKLDEEKPDVFDAIGDVSRIEYEISKKVREYGEISLVPIRYKGAEIKRKESLYFDKENGIELLGVRSVNIVKINLYYRNAEIKHHISTNCLGFTVNILHGKASDMLGISRDELKDEYCDKIEGAVLNTVKRWILSDGFNSDKIWGEDKDTALKMFAMSYGYADELKPVLGNCYDLEVDTCVKPSYVKREQFTPSLKNGKAITFNDLKVGNRIETVYGRIINVNFVMYDENENNYSIDLRLYRYSDIVINKILNSAFDNCYFHNYAFSEYFFSNTDIFSDIKEVECVSYEVVNTRLYYPYIPGYDDIYIPSGKGRDVKGIGLDSDLFSSKIAKILSPFLLVNDEIVDARNEKFYQFVQECNGKQKDKIKECYDRYVKYVVDLMCEDEYDDDTPKWKKLKEKLESK